MQLSPDQLILLAGVGTVAVWLLTVLFTVIFKAAKPNETVLKGVVFVGSTAIAYFWTPITLPPIDAGIFPFVTALLVAATAVFKLSQLIYDVIWKPIVGWLANRVTALTFLMPKR